MTPDRISTLHRTGVITSTEATELLDWWTLAQRMTPRAAAIRRLCDPTGGKGYRHRVHNGAWQEIWAAVRIATLRTLPVGGYIRSPEHYPVMTWPRTAQPSAPPPDRSPR